MADPQTPKPRRIWRIVLILSLAMNLAVAGLVVGFGVREKTDGRSPRSFDVGLGPIGGALDREDRRAIADALRNDPNVRRPGRQEFRETVTEFAQILQAKPFDPDAMRGFFETANSRISAVQLAAQSALIDRVAQMTDAERAALAARLSEMQEDRKRR